MLQHVRDRWLVENSWHWVRDTLLRQSAHRYQERNGVQVPAGLRTVALILLRLNGLHSIADALGAVSQNMELQLGLMRWNGQGGPEPAMSLDL